MKNFLDRFLIKCYNSFVKTKQKQPLLTCGLSARVNTGLFLYANRVALCVAADLAAFLFIFVRR